MPWVRVTLTPRRATPGGVATKISTARDRHPRGGFPLRSALASHDLHKALLCPPRPFRSRDMLDTAGSTAGPGRFAPATALASTRTCVRSTGSGKCSYFGSPAGASLKTIAKPLRRYDSKMALLPGLQGSIVIGTGSRTCKSRVVLAEHQGEGSASRPCARALAGPRTLSGAACRASEGPPRPAHLRRTPFELPRPDPSTARSAGSGRRSPVSARCRSRLCTCASRKWARRR